MPRWSCGRPVAHAFVLAPLLALLALAPGSPVVGPPAPVALAAPRGERLPGATFVGRLAGTEAFIAVVADGEALTVYICDGEGRGIAEEFAGTAAQEAEGALWLTGEDGTLLRLDADVWALAGLAAGGGTLTGVALSPDGSVRSPFAAQPAAEPAGLYQEAASPLLDGSVGDGWWVVLNSGEVRGNVAKNDRFITLRARTAGDVLFGAHVDVAFPTLGNRRFMYRAGAHQSSTMQIPDGRSDLIGLPCTTQRGVCYLEETHARMDGRWDKEFGDRPGGVFFIYAAIPSGQVIVSDITITVDTTQGTEVVIPTVDQP
jgi:hypothetical protein